MMPTRPYLQGEKKTALSEMDTSYISWIEQLLIIPPKGKDPPHKLFSIQANSHI